MFTRRSLVRLFLFGFVVAGVYAVMFQSSAQTALPKEIADLVPKTAVHPSGTWGGSGPLRMGSLVAELRADHPCTDSKTPGHLSIQLIYYADKSPLLSQQLASTEQQYAEKKKRFESDMARAPQNQWPRLIHWGPVKTEDGPGGSSFTMIASLTAQNTSIWSVQKSGCSQFRTRTGFLPRSRSRAI